MLVMGLDTALQSCSVAILKDGAALADERAGMEKGHAEHLAPMAAQALKKAGVTVSELDRVGVVVGPGGFTGVRVGLAFARGLVIGTEVTLIGVTSLAALAAGAQSDEGLVAAVIDARRGQVYAALYGPAGEVLVSPFVAAPEQALKKLIDKAGDQNVATVGSGAALLPGAPSQWTASGAPDEIDSKIVARLAASAPAPAGKVSPLYLRPPDAKPGKAGPFGAIGAS